MLIGEFAKRVGLSNTTIRKLEREGRITSARDVNGWRRYTEEDLEILRNVYRLPSVAKEEGV